MENIMNKHFLFNHSGEANSKSVVKGKYYRFTVLTDRIIRMEYSPSGIFEDRPSQTFWHRNHKTPFFEVKETDELLKISTKHFHLTYVLEEPFRQDTISIKMQTSSISGSGIWRYGFTEYGNELGTARTLDNIDGGKLVLDKGLFSEEGYFIWDDSTKRVFENGWFYDRIDGNEDLYYFASGDAYQETLSDFYKLTGNTPLIPRYALGNWWSRYWTYSDDELNELIDNFEARDIPLSVCIIDMDWHITHIDQKYGSGWTGYTWNRDLFKDPKLFLRSLKDRGIHNSLNLHPALGVRGHEFCYKEFAKRLDINAELEEPIEFDFTNPEFVKAYFELAHHPHEEKGVDFWWIDWQQGNNTRYKDLDPLWLLNHYHYLDLKRNDDKRGFIFSRYADLGSHRYPIGFSGDTHVTWESLAFQPYFTANAAKVGYGWWSHDIGGHMFGKEESELYTRWVQFGVFSPIMRLHTSKNFYNMREPWRHTYLSEKVVTEYLRLRHRLIPYIYTAAYKNTQGSNPLIVPMEFHNLEAKHWKNQYYFGDHLIVAPNIKKQDDLLKRSITDLYLPEGQWYDFFTGEAYLGNKEYTLYQKLNETPVFAKEGSIIPLAILIEKNQTKHPEKLELKVFPGNGSYSLYEDDGETNLYIQSKSVTTEFECHLEEDILTIRINAPEGELDLIPNTREYLVNVMGYNVEPVTVSTLEDTVVTIKLENKVEYHPTQEIMDLLECANVDTWQKSEIGFVMEKYAKERGGVLAWNVSPTRKVREINRKNVDERIKKMAIDYLLKHID